MMAPSALSLSILASCLIAHLALAEPSVQRIHRTEKKTVVTYTPPRSYPCMADWNKVCHKDSDCCSGMCLALFCRIVGVERPPAPSGDKRQRRKKGGGGGARVDDDAEPKSPKRFMREFNNKLV